LEPSDTQPVIDELKAFIDRRANELLDKRITDLHLDVLFDQQYALLLKQSVEIGHGMDIIHMRKPVMFTFLGIEPTEKQQGIDI